MVGVQTARFCYMDDNGQIYYFSIIVIYTLINWELSIYSKISWGSSTCSQQLQGGIHWGYTL